MITTNKSVRDWTELLAGDEVPAAAILDRLLHSSTSSTSRAAHTGSGTSRAS
ncbi:MAG: ATP-binding protein [Pseudomonadota bacterium]